VVLVRDGRSEQGHEAIAEELVHGSLQAMDFRERQLEERVEQAVHGLRAKTLRELCRVRHVTEQDGHLLALTFERGARRQDPFGEMRRCIGCQRGPIPCASGSSQSSTACPAKFLRFRVTLEAGGAFHLLGPYDNALLWNSGLDASVQNSLSDILLVLGGDAFLAPFLNGRQPVLEGIHIAWRSAFAFQSCHFVSSQEAGLIFS
jgi:hypothetical protein